jgi:hypothetical protein
LVEVIGKGSFPGCKSLETMKFEAGLVLWQIGKDDFGG